MAKRRAHMGAAVEALEVLLRFVQYAAAAIMFAVPVLRLYGGRRLGTGGVRNLAAAAGILALAGAGAGLVFAWSVFGEWSEALSPGGWAFLLAAFEPASGYAARAGLAGLFLVSAAALPGGFVKTWGLAFLGALILASFAWTGHGGSGEGAAGMAHRAATIAHLLAAAVWIGALAVFLPALASAGMAGPQQRGETGRELARFSGLGSAAVAVILLTGLIKSVYLIGLDGLGVLTALPYGQVFVLKMALFAGMLALAGLNRFVWVPRLMAGRDDFTAVRALRASVGLETLLGVGVLASVAVMGRLAPVAAHGA